MGSGEGQRRVLATIAELGYQVDLTARNPRTGRTGAVGLTLPASRSAELDALTAPRG